MRTFDSIIGGMILMLGNRKPVEWYIREEDKEHLFPLLEHLFPQGRETFRIAGAPISERDATAVSVKIQNPSGSFTSLVHNPDSITDHVWDTADVHDPKNKEHYKLMTESERCEHA